MRGRSFRAIDRNFLDDSTTITSSGAPSTGIPAGLDTKLDLTSLDSSSAARGDGISSLDTVGRPSIASFEPSSLTVSPMQHEADTKAQRHLREVEQGPHLRALPAREMTLRMTLTRPDLRADESLLYPGATTNKPAKLQRSMTVHNTGPVRAPLQNIESANDLLKLPDLAFGDEASTIKVGNNKSNPLRRLLGMK